MKVKILGLTLLAFWCGQLLAVEVSEQQAAVAARAWAGSGDALGLRLSSAVEETKKVVSDDDYSFYVVKMQSGGAVVLSSDTESEPVVAFTSNPDIDLAKGSPAYDLLCNDARARAKLRELAAARAMSSTAFAAATKTQAETKWAALLGSAQSGSGASLASATPVSSVSDVRRAPLIKSKWSQSEGGGGKCWNYYTPKDYPCGCVATASSQIMRYYAYPTSDLAKKTVTCAVDGKDQDLETIGGTFDWANMPLEVESSESDVKREAIGHLTYDVGVVLGMSYASQGSSASPEVIAKALRNSFKYANAFDFWDGTSYYTGKGGLHNLSLREKIIYSNLDAKRPVQLAIYGYDKGHIGDKNYWAGHSVVGDGYGYKDINGNPTAFVHINMGWQGLDDMWYNIPEINAAESGAHAGDSGTDFLYMGGATFNISTNAIGREILSGRVTDDDGMAVEGALVVVSDESDEEVGEMLTDEHGIYAFELVGDKTYSVSAVSPDGRAVSDKDGIYLKKTSGDAGYVVSASSDVGNSWGNDLVLTDPAARIGDEVFSSLDKALLAASKKLTTDQVHIELLLPIPFKSTYDIDFDCLISSVDEAEENTMVIRTAGARFNILDGGKLVLSNVVFAASQEMLVDVAEGGLLVIDDDVELAVDPGVPAVQTADSEGLELAGVPSSVFALKCTAAEEEGKFGFATCSLEEAEEGVKKIIDAYDEFGEVGGVIGEDMALEWGIRQVLPEDADAVGYYVDAEGTTNCYARFDRLIERFLNSQKAGTLSPKTTLNLIKGGELARAITVANGCELTIVGGEDVAITCADGSAITADGGKVVLRSVRFSGYLGEGFIAVNDGGELVLGDGAILNDMLSTSWHSAAVAVFAGGKLTMLDGAEISDCGYSTEGWSKNGYGGGVYLEGGSSFNMLGGTITNCVARTYGGGVYADMGSVMTVSGYATVAGNTHKTKNAADDIYKPGSALSELVLAGALVGGDIGVRWGQASSCGKNEGQEFITVGSGVSARSVRNSLVHFKNNVNPGLVAGCSGSKVFWEQPSDVPQEVAEDVAVAQVVVGTAKKYYGTLNDAFRSFTGGATVNLMADTWITAPIVISSGVTLQSVPGMGPFTLSRAGDYDISVTSGASLVVSQLLLKGSAKIGDTECSGKTAMVRVYGSTLTLNEGAEISDVEGGRSRDVSAVVVWQSGKFYMNPGSAIYCCTNSYNNPGGGGGSGAALLLDGASVGYLNGGSITNCQAVEGAVCVANQSILHVRGDVVVDGNVTLKDEPCNMMVHAESRMYVDDAFTGKAGHTSGILSDPVVFGEVTAKLDYDSLTNSAANFSNDLTGAYGVAVTNRSIHTVYLVWSDAIAKDGSVAISNGDTTSTFWCVGRNPNDLPPQPEPPEEPEVVEVVPFNLVSMVATTDGKWVVTLKPGKEWCKYTLLGSDTVGATANWQQIGEVKILSAADIGNEGEFSFTVEGDGAMKFWKVKGENGVKPVEQ